MQKKGIYTFLFSQFNPKGEVLRLYSAYQEENGLSKRVLYVIDKDGAIAWDYISPIGINPRADGILNVLEEL